MNPNTPQDHITLLAETNFRDHQVRFGIKQPDRCAHMYIIGKTRTGKSTLLETMIRQDMDRANDPLACSA